MRAVWEGGRFGPMLRVFRTWRRGGGEIAYMGFGIYGPRATIEFPSDWHEYRRAWVHIGLGVLHFAFSFPWSRVVPDDGQCSGPTYGFYFFDTQLVLRYGKTTSRAMTGYKSFDMPWAWRHRWSLDVGGKLTLPYRYVLRSGEVQERTATIQHGQTLWTRPWLPWRRLVDAINVEFSDEVGEGTGSWKGGTLGCGYTMRVGETPTECLRRMERERKFSR